ncbi:cGMP-dependent protein kinase 2 isoform X4 [Hemiscyllium ocellatum]|uniref:cGMP-dependent protein kinase 2 isoform X4 n=1 Tax=Hemiscyllium ocellatum TaxID=170820 RepID=UPI0029668F67|nr:cGMP-dependent protein kinase 2 isoform X4 [Hemiscyllium ocellatum]
MGNGLVKSKQLKEPESHTANICVNSIKFSRDNGSDSTIKATPEILQNRLLELELENKNKDDQLQEKECRIQDLEKQIEWQTRTIAEITEELQAKCIQLNKLQDVVKTQCGVLLQSSPSPLRTANRIMNQCTGLFKDIGSRRKGAKEGVSAEPTSRTYDSNKLPEFSLERARVRKDSGVKKLVTDALNRNQFLKRLETQQIRDMVECMYEKIYQHGDYVIKQGEPGNHLFVLAEGKLEVLQNNKILTSISIWTTFGELAILYNCTRTASVKALSRVKTWVLDQDVFRNIMRGTAQARHDQYRNFLRSVSLLKNLPEDKLAKIVDCLEVEYYDKGDYIIREGEEGSTFFILANGKVKVTQSTEYHIEPQLIKVLQRGDYFGEKALISDDVRSANIIADENYVECLVIDRETFNQTVGTFDELQNYLQGYVAELTRDDEKRHARRFACLHGRAEISLEMIRLKEKVATFSSTSPFRNLEIITTLGVGGFGRVELVKMKNEDVTFAVKCIKKKYIVDTRQQEHIHSEKKILEEACSPFIVRLFRSFKDNKYVYMLLEACLGGEIWSILRDRGCFDEFTAKFCTSCVTEAFDYLHRIGVIYRDLKPENLMLDSEGYIKLVDFGFAKKIGKGQKTWTFCGTPEYVAPEIILNKGHDFGVDFWSLGILVFELLTGSPPFSGFDQMMTYNLILKGVEKLDFPKKVTKRPEEMIRRLCKQNPTERLGNLKNGINDIKKHRWFSGFNWEGLKARTLPSPLKRELKGPTDYRYFDTYPPDKDIPPDELSGWDKDF